MDEAQLREIIMSKQSDGRISCRAAMAIAAEAGVPSSTIGRLLDELDIKIHSCQLGCFK
jgi:hypothetical protein